MAEQAIELPLLVTPRNPSVRFVDTHSDLIEASQILKAQSGWFAVDAERASGFKYSNRAYLIQVNRGDSPLFLIDPAAIAPDLEVERFSELASVMASDTWILHAATQDLPCLTQIGLQPTSLFDTELAGRLLGLQRVGLGAMVEQFLGFTLAKEHSAVDWSTRPLHSDWLNYAALDIDVLSELALGVRESLAAQDKLDFALEEFAALVHFKPKPPKQDRWRGLSGLHEVKDQRGLAVARELWLAREKLAARLDVAAGRLIPDASITAVAKALPRSRSALAGMKSFNGRASRSYLDTWWEGLQQGLGAIDLPPLKLAHSGIPNHRNWANKFPEADARLNSLKVALAALADQLAMPSENLLTPDYLRTLAWQPPAEIEIESIREFLIGLGARKWQATAVAETFTAVLKVQPEE